MKELTIEEKAKRYDEAIERARYWEKNPTVCSSEDICQKLFPELAGSKNERIRKWLIRTLKSLNNSSVQIDGAYEMMLPAIAWLEKQDEQKPVPDWMPKFLDELRSKKNYFDWDEHRDIEGGILAIIEWMNPNYFNGKDDGQKPADKVEPKFKVGDWVVIDGEVLHIEEVTEDGYFTDEGGLIPFRNEKEVHIWTIQDAKDGDVLNSTRVQATIIFKGFAEDGKHINAYCALQSSIFIHREMLWDRDFEPATKNWENALFDAMKKAGYEWDAEKKELKKIEHKSAWSEEDEEALAVAIIALEDMYSEDSPLDCYAGHHMPFDKAANQLKSLKERCTWRPSDEQMNNK